MLVLSREVYDTLVSRARRGRPAEICGLLAGARDSPTRIEDTFQAENVAETPETNYEIHPEEQLAIMEEIEDRGQDVVGFYHSHPAGPDRPSETDAADATWDGYSYVIVSLNGAYPFVGSWRWTGEAFEPETVHLE
ncbi:desampylase [Haladaptatus pallidirubidus]|uniref:Desampylase n=1 Tax=Haladaptatus pallidirubidus TaxID=1008152 RepID=A0AAV3UE35_9EURY|nr:desampylase [Haladaptatus pallidirubidus]